MVESQSCADRLGLRRGSLPPAVGPVLRLRPVGQLLGRLLGRLRHRPRLLGRILQLGLSRPQLLSDPDGLRVGWRSKENRVSAFPALSGRRLQGEPTRRDDSHRHPPSDHGFTFGRTRSDGYAGRWFDTGCSAAQAFCCSDPARIERYRTPGDEPGPDTLHDRAPERAGRRSDGTSGNGSNGNPSVRDPGPDRSPVGDTRAWIDPSERGAAAGGSGSASAAFGPCSRKNRLQCAASERTHTDHAVDTAQGDGDPERSVSSDGQHRLVRPPDDDSVCTEFGGPRYGTSGSPDSAGGPDPNSADTLGSLSDAPDPVGAFEGSTDSFGPIADASDSFSSLEGPSDPVHSHQGAADAVGSVTGGAEPSYAVAPPCDPLHAIEGAADTQRSQGQRAAAGGEVGPEAEAQSYVEACAQFRLRSGPASRTQAGRLTPHT